MKVVAVDGLPLDPLAAGGVFHQHWLPRAEAALADGHDVMLVFSLADHTHRDWRRAVATGLARRHAPLRVNAIAGEGARVIEAFISYLADAPGITGQYLEGDGEGAGNPAE